MKKKNIAWLLSAAVILTTAATPLEIMPVYAAEEFQADETEEAGTAETTATTAVDVAEDTTENGPVENATAETAELSMQSRIQKKRKRLQMKYPGRIHRMTTTVIWRFLMTVQRN